MSNQFMIPEDTGPPQPTPAPPNLPGVSDAAMVEETAMKKSYFITFETLYKPDFRPNSDDFSQQIRDAAINIKTQYPNAIFHDKEKNVLDVPNFPEKNCTIDRTFDFHLGPRSAYFAFLVLVDHKVSFVNVRSTLTTFATQRRLKIGYHPLKTRNVPVRVLGRVLMINPEDINRGDYMIELNKLLLPELDNIDTTEMEGHPQINVRLAYEYLKHDKQAIRSPTLLLECPSTCSKFILNVMDKIYTTANTTKLGTFIPESFRYNKTIPNAEIKYIQLLEKHNTQLQANTRIRLFKISEHNMRVARNDQGKTLEELILYHSPAFMIGRHELSAKYGKWTVCCSNEDAPKLGEWLDQHLQSALNTLINRDTTWPVSSARRDVPSINQRYIDTITAMTDNLPALGEKLTSINSRPAWRGQTPAAVLQRSNQRAANKQASAQPTVTPPDITTTITQLQNEITKLKATPATSPTSTIASPTTGVTQTELEDYVKQAINQAMRTIRTELDAKLKHHSDTIVKNMTKSFSQMLSDEMKKITTAIQKKSDVKSASTPQHTPMQQSPPMHQQMYTPSPPHLDMHQGYPPQFSPPVYPPNMYGPGAPFHHPQMEYHEQQFFPPHNQPPPPTDNHHHDPNHPETPTVTGTPSPRNLTQDFEQQDTSMDDDLLKTQL